METMTAEAQWTVPGLYDELAPLAASLPPGAVLAHVVTGWRVIDPSDEFCPEARFYAWAKIGDEPWRPVRSVEVDNIFEGWLTLKWGGTDDYRRGQCWGYRIVTHSLTWAQSYGLAGQHEVMGVQR
jgi:hypothetical protein